jgi:uncharacterized protein YbjT (DUF2867 family)
MKKYLITGSLGNISKPVVEGLVKQGNIVSVITGSQDRVADIEKLGAKALVGNLFDATFVERAFQDIDVAYTMIPPIWQTANWRKSQNEIGNLYFNALQKSNVKHVVNLSSIGAELGKGVGPVDGLYDFEQLVNQLPQLHVKHLRPSFFFQNFYSHVPLIKQAGIMGANFGEGEKIFLVHTKDIATVALEELLSLNFTNKSARYIISDERTGQEVAAAIGKAIGKELNWVVFSDEQQKSGMLQAGLSETHADGYATMGKALRDGAMQQGARKNLPAFGKTKLEDFAKEFALAFQA